MWWRLWLYPPPRRPHPAGVERRLARRCSPAGGNRLMTGPGTVRHPLGGLFLGPVSRPVPPWKCRHPAKLQKEPARRTVYAPSAGCSCPVSRVGAAEDVPRKTLDAVGPGNSSPPLRQAVLPARPGCRNSPPAVLGSHAPDQVPDSVTDIDPAGSGCRSPQGHDAPLCSSI